MKKYLIFFLIILTIGILIYFIYLPKNPLSKKEVFFNIEKGEGSKEIALNLEKQSLISWAPLFRIYVLAAGAAGNLKAGEYILSFSMNIPEIADKFVEGDIVKENITIIEGWNLRDIGFYFENRGMFQAEELWEIAGFPAADYSKTKDLPLPKDFSSDYDFLKDKPKSIGLEGYLFPETYEINKRSGAEEIIRNLLDVFDGKMTTQIKQEIANQKKTIFEIITMASLIEKEVKTKKDKELVSGILWKRLKAGMPLQVDATISYFLGKKTSKIFRQDTQIESPYNTYRHKGLPLGPISNPGIESILAAIYPRDSDYWYYLSAPDGETIFSRTLEEHNIAKAKYLY